MPKRKGLGSGSVDRHLARQALRSSLHGIHIDDLHERLASLGADPRRGHGSIRCRTICHNSAGEGDLNLVFVPVDDGGWKAYCKSSNCAYREIVGKVLALGPITRVEGSIADSATLAAASRDEFVKRPDIFPQERFSFLYDCHLDLLDYRFSRPQQFDGHATLLDYLENERCISKETVKACMLGWLRNQRRLTIPYKLPEALSPSYQQSGGIYQLDRWQPPFWRSQDYPKLLAETGIERWLFYPIPDMIQDECWLTEGAMDALAAVSCGLPAIGAPSSSSWFVPWSQELQRLGIKSLHIVPDNDAIGRKFARHVRRRLRSDAPDIKVDICRLHNIGEGEDLVDWLQDQ